MYQNEVSGSVNVIKLRDSCQKLVERAREQSGVFHQVASRPVFLFQSFDVVVIVILNEFTVETDSRSQTSGADRSQSGFRWNLKAEDVQMSAEVSSFRSHSARSRSGKHSSVL